VSKRKALAYDNEGRTCTPPRQGRYYVIIAMRGGTEPASKLNSDPRKPHIPEAIAQGRCNVILP
jgi:hypothetical protein